MNANRVLEIAINEIGYQAGLDPLQGSKYGRWARDVTGQAWLGATAKQVPYCNLFVSWVFAQAGAGPAIGVNANTVFAYTVAHLNWFKTRNKIVPIKEAEPGDIVFFDWNPTNKEIVEHVGIVEKNLSNGQVQTIEGNTARGDVGSQTHGGGVWRRTRKTGIKYVCRPEWAHLPAPVTNQPRKASNMVIIRIEQPGHGSHGATYFSDGIHARHCDSPTLLNQFSQQGIPTVSINAVELNNNFIVLNPDDLKIATRVRDIKDILTDVPGAQKPNVFTK